MAFLNFYNDNQRGDNPAAACCSACLIEMRELTANDGRLHCWLTAARLALPCLQDAFVASAKLLHALRFFASSSSNYFSAWL